MMTEEMSAPSETVRPAVAFPPGEYLADELEERGWTISEFATIIGRPVQAVSEIINGRKEITPETAREIAAATGTTAETWLRLEDAYRLWKLEQEPDERLPAVARRARMAALVPIPQLRRRGIIPDADIDAQERALCEFLGVAQLDEPVTLGFAARRTGLGVPWTPAQVAWLASVRHEAAKRATPAKFDPDGRHHR